MYSQRHRGSTLKIKSNNKYKYFGIVNQDNHLIAYYRPL